MCVRESACVVSDRRVENPSPSRVYSRLSFFFFLEYSGESAYNTSYLHTAYERVSVVTCTEDYRTTVLTLSFKSGGDKGTILL